MRNTVILFLSLLLLTVLLILLDRSGPVEIFKNGTQAAVSLPRAFVYGIFHRGTSVIKSDSFRNNDLILTNEELKKENEALRSQFETALIPSTDLLPARVVGFLGEAHNPNSFIINQGERSNVQEGMAVIFQDHLVGVVDSVSSQFSTVILPMNDSFRILGKVVGKEATGVVLGQGKEVRFENVVTSTDIGENDIVRTYENQTNTSFSIPDDLVIGKITDVNKDRSVPLKSGSIKSYVVFPNLHTVFVVK